MKTFDELKDKLKNLPEKKRVGVVAAQDEHTLDALLLAAGDGLIEPVLFGDKKRSWPSCGSWGTAARTWRSSIFKVLRSAP